MVAPSVMALVDEIRRRRLSRNKHFALFARREYREAHRIGRYLDHLAQDLATLADAGELHLHVEPGADGRWVLTVERPRLQLRRCCHLSDEELDYLVRHHAPVARHIAAAASPPLRCGAPDSPNKDTQGGLRDG